MPFLSIKVHGYSFKGSNFAICIFFHPISLGVNSERKEFAS